MNQIMQELTFARGVLDFGSNAMGILTLYFILNFVRMMLSSNYSYEKLQLDGRNFIFPAMFASFGIQLSMPAPFEAASSFSLCLNFAFFVGALFLKGMALLSGRSEDNGLLHWMAGVYLAFGALFFVANLFGRMISPPTVTTFLFLGFCCLISGFYVKPKSSVALA
jgi:hypothetical protein